MKTVIITCISAEFNLSPEEAAFSGLLVSLMEEEVEDTMVVPIDYLKETECAEMVRVLSQLHLYQHELSNAVSCCIQAKWCERVILKSVDPPTYLIFEQLLNLWKVFDFMAILSAMNMVTGYISHHMLSCNTVEDVVEKWLGTANFEALPESERSEIYFTITKNFNFKNM